MRGNMSESAQLGKSVTPPEGAAVLAGDPLPGITAQGFADELGEDLSDHRLAEAISLAWAKVGNLMHLVEEDDALGSELDEWLDLERELCQEALARDGATLREGLSLTELIALPRVRSGTQGIRRRLKHGLALPKVRLVGRDNIHAADSGGRAQVHHLHHAGRHPDKRGSQGRLAHSYVQLHRGKEADGKCANRAILEARN